MSTIVPTIRIINEFPRSDRTKEMVLFARRNEKLARAVTRTDFLRTLALAKTSVVVTGQCIGPAANMMSLGEGKRMPCTTNTKPIGTDTCNIQTIYHTVVVGWRRQRAACAHPPTQAGAQWLAWHSVIQMALDGARSPPKKTDWPDRHFAVGRTKHAFLLDCRKLDIFPKLPSRYFIISSLEVLTRRRSIKIFNVCETVFCM